MDRRIFFIGAGGLAAVALASPLVARYLGRREGGRPIQPPKFDRSQLVADLGAAGFALGANTHVRIYKQEHRLEVWLRAEGQQRFAMFRSYEICRYSGGLGPKLAEGDRQAPEGFYRVAHRQLNPYSRHHLAFNLGFPNAYDRAHGRTGSFLMVHGGCTSIGCYAMTDARIDEIYALVEAALDAGQGAVDVSIFPFRMTDTAMQAVNGSQWLPFWTNLKQGADLFEASGEPPPVAVLDGRYVFAAEASHPASLPIEGWV